MKNTRNLIIPVELKSRELSARLLLAKAAADLGFKVYVGPAKVLHDYISFFPHGVIIENDATRASEVFLTNAKKQGFGLVAYDEEAISTISNEWYTKQRVSPISLSQLDILFTRSYQDLFAIANRFPKLKNRLVVAGNPRIDLLKLKVASEKLNGHEPIVVMSRFSRSNPFSISKYKAWDNAVKKFKLTGKDEKFYRNFLKYTDQIFLEFIKLIPFLANKFPNRKIIIRPHPSENFRLWENLAESFQNVHVESTGCAIDLSKQSSVVIHNGCTTGLEAALIGKKVISYMPIKDKKYDVALPNLVSKKAFSLEQLEILIRETIQHPENASALVKESQNKVFGVWIGPKPWKESIHVIVDSINNKYEKILGQQSKLARIEFFMKVLKRKFSDYLYVSKELKHNRKNYLLQKTNKISISEVEGIIGAKDFKIKKLYCDWFVIWK